MTSLDLTAKSRTALQRLVLALADDEFVLGHRDSEWTGYGPILEEDIAFSNIAQDEIGHALVWYSIYQELAGPDPDRMAFGRPWQDFTCCHFVEYPKNDFAYTVVRQYLFDMAEEVRLRHLAGSSYAPLAGAAARISKEESYHRLHLQSLFERLGSATPESVSRMQAALQTAFPQALGMFEPVEDESELIGAGIYAGNAVVEKEWSEAVREAIRKTGLALPPEERTGNSGVRTLSGYGGRMNAHTPHLKALVGDLQTVLGTAPDATW
ncbi:MAG TPA: 1,2-phenylacetyl-CoA epoxidase subunit PaaC [Bacteroidota bacterium]|nr:1,2-phenylacetyl-CoA epoxidase subunit PaaC [Bacteroidota bacterium]